MGAVPCSCRSQANSEQVIGSAIFDHLSITKKYLTSHNLSAFSQFNFAGTYRADKAPAFTPKDPDLVTQDAENRPSSSIVSVTSVSTPDTRCLLLSLPLEFRQIIYLLVLGGIRNQILFEGIPVTHRIIPYSQIRGHSTTFATPGTVFTLLGRIRDYTVPDPGQRRLRSRLGFNNINFLLACKAIYIEARLLQFAKNTVTFYHTRMADSLLPSLARLYGGLCAMSIKKMHIMIITVGRKDALDPKVLTAFTNLEQLILDVEHIPLTIDDLHGDRGRARLDAVKQNIIDLCMIPAKKITVAFHHGHGDKLPHQVILHKHLGLLVKELEIAITEKRASLCSALAKEKEKDRNDSGLRAVPSQRRRLVGKAGNVAPMSLTSNEGRQRVVIDLTAEDDP